MNVHRALVPAGLLILASSPALAAEADIFYAQGGGVYILIPILIMAVAIIGGLLRKKSTDYRSSLDILRKRCKASEAKPGFYQYVTTGLDEKEGYKRYSD